MIFKKKDSGSKPPEKEGKYRKKRPKIVVLKKTPPGVCGGTDATLDVNAPRVIPSTDIELFDVSTAMAIPINGIRDGAPPLHSFCAFACPSELGVFTLLKTTLSGFAADPVQMDFAVLKDDFLPELAALLAAHNVAANNGFHSRTHGLPENFGGHVSVRFKGGDSISISNNQSPVLTYPAGAAIVELFKKALAGERVPFPSPEDLSGIRFLEERGVDGFTAAEMKILPDGSGINKKQSRYSDPKVYESSKELSAETVSGILKNIADNGLFLWAALPKNKSSFERCEKEIAFTFKDGREIVVSGVREAPDPISRGFFNVELELAVKN